MKVWVSTVRAANEMWITSSEEVIWTHTALFTTEKSAVADNADALERALEDGCFHNDAEVYEMEVKA